MCFVRIGTSKGQIHHEFVNTDYNNIKSKDILQVVIDKLGHSTKDNKYSVLGWLEVNKDNKTKEDE